MGRFKEYYWLLGLIGLCALVHSPALFSVPRSDQLVYIYLTNPFRDNFSALMEQALRFQRADLLSDFVLYRPLTFILLGIARWTSGVSTFLWQIPGYMAHLVLVALMFLSFRARRRSEWVLALLLSTFFGVNFGTTEMVNWTHIFPYIFALIIFTVADFTVRRACTQPHPANLAAVFFIALSGACINEIGALLAFACAGGLVLNGILTKSRRYYLPALLLALSTITYAVMNVGDFYYRFGVMPNLKFVSASGASGSTLGPLLEALDFWLRSSFVPDVSTLQSFAGRLTWTSEPTFLNVALGVFTGVAIGATVVFLLIANVRKSNWKPVRESALYFLFLFICVGVLVAGRVNERGSSTITINSYYTEFFLFFLLNAVYPLFWGIRALDRVRYAQWLPIALFAALGWQVVNHAFTTFSIHYQVAEGSKFLRHSINLANAYDRQSGDPQQSFHLAKDCAELDYPFSWRFAHDSGIELKNFTLMEALFRDSYRPKGTGQTIDCR